MNKKIYLEAPQAELIVVRFEDNILSGKWDDSIKPGTTWSTDDPEDGYGLE
ncbi:MAG: hypothetical protein II874_04855 [Bacteroidales bacterium]|nr:hypothetical protein [Bacteroidales bacterium]